MAILNKLFSSKKKNTNNTNRTYSQHFNFFGKSEHESWKPFEFTEDRVRILLFRECPAKRRKILFDSCSVEKVQIDSNKLNSVNKTEFIEITNGFGYKCIKPKEEVNFLTLGDMIFGTVPLVYQGTCLKIHSLKQPSRIMCTKVFPSPSNSHQGSTRVSESLDDSIGSIGDVILSESVSSSTGNADSSGVLFKSLEDLDSGFCGSLSVTSSWLPSEHNSMDSKESSCSSSSVGSSWNNSSGSLYRRWWRHISTSLDTCPNSSSNISTNTARRSKLAIAVILKLSTDQNIEKKEQTYLFDHISVVENILNRLRAMVERAYLRRETYWFHLKEGADELEQAFVDLFSARRLSKPIWLGLLKTETSIAHTFLSELCHLISTLDTKATNFFISTLVTGVLTHHLGWVPTVFPGAFPQIQNQQSTNKLLNLLSKSHPYNALWAQLGDLQGALGNPLRVSRTIITGQKNDLLDRLIRVLSYFIRCGNVSTIEQDLNIETETEGTNSTATLVNNDYIYPTMQQIKEKVNKLCRVPTATKIHMPRKMEAEIQTSCALERENVIFVLGENERLVGIKEPRKEICEQAEDCCLLINEFTNDVSSSEDEYDKPQLFEIDLPCITKEVNEKCNNCFAQSLIATTSNHYISDMVLLSCTEDINSWKHKLRRDLVLSAHQPLFDKEIAEAVCVLADTIKWEVQIVSSHTYVVDQPGNLGFRQGMSQFIANMLEAVHHLWKLNTPAEHCLQYIESKLREICLHSHALAQLLISTDCCEMEQLTSSLNLEANDVPLLLSVASTHSPQVTQRYGITFR